MFDLQRFARLAAATWAENRRAWAWFLGVVVMLHFVLVLIQLADGSGYDTLTVDGQEGTFLFGLYLTAPIFAARYFQGLARPGSALLLLMRPASVFEKWLLAVLVVAVAYPIAFQLAFYLCDVPAFFIADAQFDRFAARIVSSPNYEIEKWREGGRLFFLFADTPRGDLIETGLTVTAFQAFAMLGALVFRTMPFIKTLVAAFVVLLACVLAAIAFDGDPSPFFSYWTHDVYRSSLQRLFLPVVWIAVPMLLWIATFLALREREVA
jgi:hypothetical protein